MARNVTGLEAWGLGLEPAFVLVLVLVIETDSNPYSVAIFG
jgi:hypothetical protein